MLNLIKNEIYKMLRSKKLYYAFLIMLAFELSAVIQYNFMANKPEMNGQSLFFTLLDFLPFLFALFMAVFISDLWTEEAATLKLTLTRPVQRAALLNAKVASFFLCLTLIVLFTMISSGVIGTIAFGWGSKIDFQGTVLTSTPMIEAYLKTALSLMLPMLGFGLLVTFIAIFTDNSGITIGVSLGLTILSTLIETMEAVKTYSIVYQMRTFYQSILQGVPLETIGRDLGVVMIYVILFYGLCCLYFGKKDIIT